MSLTYFTRATRLALLGMALTDEFPLSDRVARVDVCERMDGTWRRVCSYVSVCQGYEDIYKRMPGIWRGEGTLYDLMTRAVCSKPARKPT